MLTTIPPQDQLRILERLDLEDQRLLREAVERSNKKTKSVQRGARIPGLLSAEEQEQ
jgi:hypothetical protein